MRCYLFILFVFIQLSTVAQRLVLPGDFPDPSVVKIGDTYWASATTSNWGPVYPLLQSKDLLHWQTSGHVFNQLPEWADYYFWAPEITYDNGKVYIYYSAHKRDGNLCVGIASADKPEGPYTDHGPLICQEVGSIDAFPMRDENGTLYMVWKEDANSVGKPTPIWIQQLNEARTALIGEKQELFRNTLDWEGQLVEGVSMLRQGDYYYAFYAAAGCCGRECNYVTGIARSKKLMGPWEKQQQPLINDNAQWKCPGHGTPVVHNGKHYLLYHAYNKTSNVYTGREGVLSEFEFTPDGWIRMIEPEHDSITIPNHKMTNNALEPGLNDAWQWSVFQKPDFAVRGDLVELEALAVPSGAFLGKKTTSANYNVTVQINAKRSSAAAGLALIGDDNNTVRAVLENGQLQVVQLREGKDSMVLQKPWKPKRKAFLQMQVRNGKDVTFLASRKRKRFEVLNGTPVDGTYLPPWDRALRAGVVSKGAAGQRAFFKNFSMQNHY